MHNLTHRQIQIMKLICEEKSTKQIAAHLGISKRTVESIKERIRLNTGIETNVGLVIFAIRHGIYKL